MRPVRRRYAHALTGMAAPNFLAATAFQKSGRIEAYKNVEKNGDKAREIRVKRKARRARKQGKETIMLLFNDSEKEPAVST